MTVTKPESTAVNGLGDAKHSRDIQLSPERSRIDVDRYTSVEFAQKESEKLWQKVWQIACREDEVAEAGDYYEYTIGTQSYLIVRGDDGAIRAFHNVCLHRANVLKQGCGNAGSELVCPFHLWSYKLDGSLNHIADRETFCEIDDSEYGLGQVLADTWGGWVFIHPNPEQAEPLLDFLDPLPEQLAQYHFEHLVPVGMNLTTTVSCNWKVAVEAFLEVYHTQGVHPQLLPSVDDVNTLYETLGNHNRMIIELAQPSPRLGPDVDPQEILAAMFGFEEGAAEEKMSKDVELGFAKVENPEDRRATSTGSLGDIFEATQAGPSPMVLFDQYRDEQGNINLPEGTTVRSILREAGKMMGQTKGVDFSELSENQWIDDWHYLLFPNVVLNVTTASVLYFRFLPDGDDPNRCRWDLIAFEWIPDKEKAAEVRAKRVAVGEREQSLGLIMDQDWYQMPRVQRGLRSKGLKHVTLSSQEVRLVHFNEVLDRHLAR